MARMNGERVQEWNSRRAHAIESAVATKAWQVEREMKIRNGVPLPIVEVEQACTCELYPFAHFHQDEAHDSAYRLGGAGSGSAPPMSKALDVFNKGVEVFQQAISIGREEPVSCA